MPVSVRIGESFEKSSFIRKMFERGARLKAQLGEENVFDFSIGNPDLPPPREFHAALTELVTAGEGLHGYIPDGAGFRDTRQAVAKTVTREQGVEIKDDNIVMTCGAAGGLNTVFRTILNPGDEVIVPRPYFVDYGFYIGNHGGEMVTVETDDDFSLDMGNIEAAINERTRAVLINSPNNPTGKVYSENEITALASVLQRYSETHHRPIYLLSDEPYRNIVYDGIRVPSVFKHYRQSVVVSSYSKTLSIAGERIGYIAANPSCEGVGTFISGCVLSNRILGFVNAPALMQRVIARMRYASVDVSLYERRRNLLTEGLGEAGYRYAKPEGAFYLFCRSPVADDVIFTDRLQEQNILAVPGSGFGCPGHFRLSYAVPEEVIRKALPGFLVALQSL
jgi:aspartate aminotransferase